MTRDEARELAKKLTLQSAKDFTGASVSFYNVVCHAIEVALDRALTPSRIEAAERDVVEAAFAWANRYAAEPTQHDTRFLRDALNRLHNIREHVQCGDTHRVELADIAHHESLLICRLARGHELPHRGDLGTWSWE